MSEPLSLVKLLSAARNFQILLGLFIFCLLLYFPVLNNNFLSDDYTTLYRVALLNEIRIDGFFRPLSDTTMWVTHQLFGLKAFYYNFFNLLIHVATSYLLFLVCLKFNWFKTDNLFFGIFCAFLFASYPFHNESVVWVVGRGSSMAALFALGGIYAYISNNRIRGITVAAVLYFLGLLAYESIFPLPIFLIIYCYLQTKKIKKSLVIAAVFSVPLLFHLVIRKWFAGVTIGAYAFDFFHASPTIYVSRFLKLFGRLFLPPIENPTTMILLFLIVVVVLIVSISKILGKKGSAMKLGKQLWLTLMFILASLLVPIMFSISTKTSEGDRLLYFPSAFVCLFIGLVLVGLTHNTRLRVSIAVVLILYNLFFLQANNQNWIRASRVTQILIDQCRSFSQLPKKIIIVNLPGDYEGAYIFRNGFKEALALHKIPSANINVVSVYSESKDSVVGDSIQPVVTGTSLYIPPHTYFIRSPATTLPKQGPESVVVNYEPLDQEIWYWNKRRLVQVVD